jgi:tRNA(Ile)-lysidine synthase
MSARRRSHPPALLKIVERTLREECGIERGDRVLVAVSGGGDSAALLHCLGRLSPRLGIAVYAHGVDHGLRPEAASELDLAEALARDLKLPFARSVLGVHGGSNLQARARAARYRALREAASEAGCRLIATAHHADDRAETVLIRLLRGAGTRGLGVLPPRAGDLIRPMIRARKAAVDAHLTRHAIAFARDPSNRDRRFLRVRVREEVLPLLESLSPGIVEHLDALADQLASGPQCAVLDEHGREVALGRAHLDQIRRAQARRLLDARIRLSGGREIRIDPATGRPTVHESPKAR